MLPRMRTSRQRFGSPVRQRSHAPQESRGSIDDGVAVGEVVGRGDDTSANLVAEADGQDETGVVAVEVAAADPTGVDTDHHLAGRGLGRGNVAHFDALRAGAEDGAHRRLLRTVGWHCKAPRW